MIFLNSWKVTDAIPLLQGGNSVKTLLRLVIQCLSIFSVKFPCLPIVFQVTISAPVPLTCTSSPNVLGSICLQILKPVTVTLSVVLPHSLISQFVIIHFKFLSKHCLLQKALLFPVWPQLSLLAPSHCLCYNLVSL